MCRYGNLPEVAYLQGYCRAVEDRDSMQDTSLQGGGEAKPLPYLLARMNLGNMVMRIWAVVRCDSLSVSSASHPRRSQKRYVHLE
uniref:Uncharacterized protein n=1 Tax=Candidatus Kentrum sp. LPFa TaxID=2126335 RepID=A0A450WUB1_9GAMM|nr:MAG: hypothetical protein BECKLPF1236A_GA0070988_102705 [Candidatus Kentron sp. LPFa]VFK34523.1 MAG: hypothetical protein BECKLPF1236C_GA0070990_102772 [Candidatus Kentron sp. LPFa]